MKRLAILAVFFALSLPSGAFAAVAVDSSAISSDAWTAGAGPISWTHTATANSGLTNTLGLVYTAYESLPSAAPTWSGVSMTLVDNTVACLSGKYSLYAIVNPAYSTSGTTISFPWSTGTNYHNGISVLLTGANQSTTLDNYGTASSGASGTFAPTLTTVADNSLVLAFVYNNAGATITAGANTTMMAGTGESLTSGRKSSVTTPAGLTTLNFTRTGTPSWCAQMASVAPVAVAATPKSILSLVKAFWIW